MKEFILLAMPAVLFPLLWRMQEIVVIIFLGASGADNFADLIAGFGIGTFFVNLLFNSISFGLNGALETLVSQAYGAKDIEMCAVYLHRSRLVLLMFLIPCIGLLANTEKILQLLKQPEIAS